MNDRSRSGPLRSCVRGLLIAAAVLAASFPARAVAQPARTPPIQLGWDAPDSCPRSGDIEGEVRALLGDAPIPDDAPPVTADVALRQSPDRSFEVRVRLSSGAEIRERELRVDTCDEARQLVAFLLAFLIDPRAKEPLSPPPSAPPTPAPRPPLAKAPPPTSPDASPARRRDAYPRGIASVLLAADTGMLPGVSAGAELRAGLLFSAWSVEARAAAWLPRRAESSNLAGAGGEFTLLDAGVFACARVASWEVVSVRTCAGPALLSLRGSGYGVQTPAKEQALFAAGAAEAALLLATSEHTALRLGLGAVVPFRRPPFAIREVGPIHRPAVLAGRAALGLELRF